jgi:hypothetical protein
MFSNNRGDVVLPASIDPLPKLTLEQIPEAPQPAPAPGRAGAPAGRGRGPTGPFDGIYVSATREDATQDVILKLVNIQATAQPLRIDLQGVTRVDAKASGEMITGDLGAVNTVAEPKKVTPTAIAIVNAGPMFVYDMPAHSVSVIRVKTR